MKHICAAVFATIGLMNTVGFALADDECIKCKLFHQYICSQDRNECVASCRRFVIGDKEGCQQRCFARGHDCRQTTVQKCGTCAPEKYALPPSTRIQ
jgi:hypothetical protein